MHLARRDPERGAVRRALFHRRADMEAAGTAPDPHDLVVQVVVPWRSPRRDVAGEHRCARGAVMRAEQDLERAAACRLPGSTRSIETMRSRAPMGACRSTSPPIVTRTAASPSAPALSSACSPSSSNAAEPFGQVSPSSVPAPANANRSTSWPASPASMLVPGSSRSVSSASSEPRCGAIVPAELTTPISGRGTPCAGPRSAAARQRCPRAQRGRSRARSPGPRSRATRSHSAPRRASPRPTRAPAG